MTNDKDVEPSGPDSFGGTDEESHYMSQTRIKPMRKFCELCERHGIQTASASFEELIERIDRQLVILKRNLQRAKQYGKDPSGRWA